RLLSAGSPAARPRHQTLRAAVDWSHELCTEREQSVWARLSVLAGSFDLETAEAVCADEEGMHAYDVLEAVAGLVDKSVLCREAGPDGVRYRLLDTLRHYGLEKLRHRADDETAVRRRQRDWMQQRAAACERAWFGPGQREIVARLRADQDNLRAALDFSLTTPGEALAALRLAGTLWFYWHACGAPREGRYWLDRALDANPEPTPERARALWVSGLLAGCPEDLTRGRRRAEEARTLARRPGGGGARRVRPRRDHPVQRRPVRRPRPLPDRRRPRPRPRPAPQPRRPRPGRTRLRPRLPGRGRPGHRGL
ncbi:ATP-binding protein, partial [Streptomyces sp. KR55]|uniref:ATP-binding protein n=1 Tax=Streptomyces sp. KR55 TaxID=3457425 RepID=UPI003FD52DA3